MRRRQFWQKQRDQEVAQVAVVVEPPPEPETVVSKLTPKCSKCGRELVRGLFMHQKYCKGEKS